MRFDIPVIGLQTLRSMKKAGIRCLALEAGGAILIARDAVIRGANAAGMVVFVLEKKEI